MARNPRPPRYPLPVPVTFAYLGGYVVGELVDVSATGLLARVRGRIPLGVEVLCELDAPGHHLALTGTVMRFDRHGREAELFDVGVDFGVPDPRLWALLDDLDHGRIRPGGRVARLSPDETRGAPGVFTTPAPPPAPAAHLAVEQPFVSYAVATPAAPAPEPTRPPVPRPVAAPTSVPSTRATAEPACRPAPGGRGAEKRSERRYPVRLLALVDHEKIGGRARVLDISAHGAHVVLEGRLHALAAEGANLRFRLNFREIGHVAAWARVVWVRDEGDRAEVGLAFTHVAEESVGPLARLVERLGVQGGAAAAAEESLIRP